MATTGADRPDRGTAWPGRAAPRYAVTPVRGSAAPALLAQSVEHSHGKAGVVGSIPTEGSSTRPRVGRLALAA